MISSAILSGSDYGLIGPFYHGDSPWFITGSVDEGNDDSIDNAVKHIVPFRYKWTKQSYDMIWWMILITTSASTVATANTASPSYDMQHNELTLFFALYKARQKQWNIAIIRSSHDNVSTY
eukprot:895674_1